MPTQFVAVPDWGSWENQGAGLAVGDLDGDGQLELVVLQVDNPGGANRGLYRVGRGLDAQGQVTGGWGPWMAIDWFSWENAGAGVALADLDADGRSELVVLQVDAPAEANGAFYQVGWELDADGVPAGGWSPWVEVPDWFSWENQGADAALADLDGDGRAELVLLAIDSPPGANAGLDAVVQLELDVDEAATKGAWRLLPGDSGALAIHAALLHTGCGRSGASIASSGGTRPSARGSSRPTWSRARAGCATTAAPSACSTAAGAPSTSATRARRTTGTTSGGWPASTRRRASASGSGLPRPASCGPRSTT